MKRISIYVAAAMLTALGASSALADPVPLVMNSISADGLTVISASCSATGTGSCSNVYGAFYTDPTTHDLALAITGVGGGILENASGTQTGDLTVTFDVTSTTDVTGIILAAAGSVTGDGSAGVGETVFDNTTAQQVASGNTAVGGSATLPFSASSIPISTTDFSVTKDIHVTGNNGLAYVSSVDQVFQGVAVPAPAGLALFGPAAALLGFVRRRRA
jgi:hypothetical protein